VGNNHQYAVSDCHVVKDQSRGVRGYIGRVPHCEGSSVDLRGCYGLITGIVDRRYNVIELCASTDRMSPFLGSKLGITVVGVAVVYVYRPLGIMRSFRGVVDPHVPQIGTSCPVRVCGRVRPPHLDPLKLAGRSKARRCTRGNGVALRRDADLRTEVASPIQREDVVLQHEVY